MTETICRYAGDRDQAIVSCLYGDADADDFDRGERAAFEAHAATCDRCRTELAAFAEVRASLGAWSPPPLRSAHPSIPGVTGRAGDPLQALGLEPEAVAPRSWWRDTPVWAQAAAAILCLGVGAGIANLDVEYGAGGLRVRTGWLTAPGAVAEPRPARDVTTASTDAAGHAPWRAELAALEQRLRSDISQASTPAPDDAGANALRRVRALVDESERRQQRELALRLGEAMRDMNAQRQADLTRIDRNIGAIQSTTGREMLRQRSEMLNYVTVRTASQRGQ